MWLRGRAGLRRVGGMLQRAKACSRAYDWVWVCLPLRYFNTVSPVRGQDWFLASSHPGSLQIQFFAGRSQGTALSFLVGDLQPTRESPSHITDFEDKKGFSFIFDS